MLTFIYCLSDPRTDTVRYIGKTKMAFATRFKKHYCPSSLVLETRVARWIKHLRSLGLKPTMDVVEACEDHQWEAAERRWISTLRMQGLDLVNLTDGGEGGGVKGRPCSQATRAKISAANKGKTGGFRPLLWLGRHHSLETRRKMSIARTLWHQHQKQIGD